MVETRPTSKKGRYVSGGPFPFFIAVIFLPGSGYGKFPKLGAQGLCRKITEPELAVKDGESEPMSRVIVTA
jgi:hypothetical protein